MAPHSIFHQRFNDRFDKNKANFFKVSAWRKLGEFAGKYVKRGSKLYVRCDKIETNTYTNNNGETRVSIDVTANDIELLNNKGENSNHSEETVQQTAQATSQSEPYSVPQGFTGVELDDGLPF